MLKGIPWPEDRGPWKVKGPSLALGSVLTGSLALESRHLSLDPIPPTQSFVGMEAKQVGEGTSQNPVRWSPRFIPIAPLPGAGPSGSAETVKQVQNLLEWGFQDLCPIVENGRREGLIGDNSERRSLTYSQFLSQKPLLTSSYLVSADTKHVVEGEEPQATPGI